MRTDALLEKEVAQVFRALTPENELVCQVALHTGLRVGDVLKLRTDQLKPQFWVTESKTGKRRQVGIPGPLLDRLRQYAGEEWAFPGRIRGHRTRQAVWSDVKRAAKLFRFPQNVGVHSLRKTYAQEVLRQTGDLEKVKRALNHSSAAVTMVYLIAAENMKRKHLRPATPGRRRL